MKITRPWTDGNAIEWIRESDSMRQMCRLVEGTLRLDVKSYPHQIRAAASMVIMLCRKDLWFSESPDEDSQLDEVARIAGLAARQMATVKQLFEQKAKSKPELIKDRSFRKLLDSMTQEIRILESRMSESPSNLPNEPPCTWGDFW